MTTFGERGEKGGRDRYGKQPKLAGTGRIVEKKVQDFISYRREPRRKGSGKVMRSGRLRSPCLNPSHLHS